jgi:excisionase family DNA binding protein
MTQLSPFLTADEVATRLSVTAEAVRAWARTGKVEAIKLPGGRQYRFRREVIEALERGESAIEPQPVTT